MLVALGVIAWPVLFDTTPVREMSQRSQIPTEPALERFSVDEPQPPQLPLQWAVQLGAFSKAEAAQAIKRRAEQAGFHAIVQTVPTDSGTLHKVYVNPKLDRAEAQALAAQVEKKLAVKGYVTRYYP